VPAPHTGRCVCGATKYRLNEEPILVYACHCTDCQKRSGSAFGMSMWVKRSALELQQGEPILVESKTESGRLTRLRYCHVCNTRMWSESLRHPALAVMRAGTLDDTSWLRPVAHIWTRSAQPWVLIPEGAPRFETQPEDLFAALGARR
jgi:hypothetical protein